MRVELCVKWTSSCFCLLMKTPKGDVTPCFHHKDMFRVELTSHTQNFMFAERERGGQLLSNNNYEQNCWLVERAWLLKKTKLFTFYLSTSINHDRSTHTQTKALLVALEIFPQYSLEMLFWPSSFFVFFSRKCKNKWPIEIIDYRGDFCLLRDDFLIRGAFENCLSAWYIYSRNIEI